MIVIAPGLVTLSDRRTQSSWAVELAPYELAALAARPGRRQPRPRPGVCATRPSIKRCIC